MPLSIIVSIDAWFDFLCSVYLLSRNLKIGGIRRWIKFEFHDAFAFESKNAVTTATGRTVPL